MEQVQKDMAEYTAREYCLHQVGKGRMVLLSNGTEMRSIEDNNYLLSDEEAALYAAAKMGLGKKLEGGVDE